MRGLKRTVYLFLACVIICASAIAASGDPATAAAIMITDSRFPDYARDRTIPFRIYAPNPVTGPSPAIIFSHELGGSVEDTAWLGEALAANGYLVFVVQHPGSDKEIWKGLRASNDITQALRQSMRNPQNRIDRYEDLAFFLDQIETLNEIRGPLRGNIDLNRIGMAGLGLGAHDVMVAVGEKTGRTTGKYVEERIRAGVVISPSPPESYIGLNDEDIAPLYTGVNTPLFHITGTNDEHPLRTGFTTELRTTPYRTITAPHQYLMVLSGAEHSTFAANELYRAKVSHTFYQKLVGDAVIKFFDAYLRGDSLALEDLRIGLPQKLAPGDRFEFK